MGSPNLAGPSDRVPTSKDQQADDRDLERDPGHRQIENALFEFVGLVCLGHFFSSSTVISDPERRLSPDLIERACRIRTAPGDRDLGLTLSIGRWRDALS